MIYILSCGCRHSKETISRINSGLKNHFTCPDHPGEIVASREKPCDDCGTPIAFSVRGFPPARCDPCREKWTKSQQKKRNQVRPRGRTQEITHVYACGCRESREKAKKMYVDCSKRFACQKHREPVEYRETSCEMCGLVFPVYSTAAIPRMCPECGNGKAVRYGLSPAIEACSERYDCGHRNVCLDQMRNADHLPCLGCERYYRKRIEIELPVSRYDPYAWAYGEVR